MTPNLERVEEKIDMDILATATRIVGRSAVAEIKCAMALNVVALCEIV